MSRRVLLLLVLGCLNIISTDCGDNPKTITPNPVGPTDNNEKDSIPVLRFDTTTSIDSTNLAPLYVNIDLWKSYQQLADSNKSDTSDTVRRKSLAKTGTSDGLNRLAFKISRLFEANFILTDSLNRSVKLTYPIDSGKCAVHIIKIPRGFCYRVWVGFSGKIYCPSDSSNSIINEYFFGFDTVNLLSKTKDTLNLILIENSLSWYFLTVKNPVGKYTEKNTYNQESNIKAVFSSGELMSRVSCRKNDSTTQLIVNDDTGKVSFNVVYNVSSAYTDGVIKGITSNQPSPNPDTGDGIIVDQIVFEHQTPLKAIKIEPKNGGIAFYFNRNGRMSVDDSTIFKITQNSDTINFANKTEIKCEMDGGYILWIPATPLQIGTYKIQIQGIKDEYGKRSLMAQYTIRFQP